MYCSSPSAASVVMAPERRSRTPPVRASGHGPPHAGETGARGQHRERGETALQVGRVGAVGTGDLEGVRREGGGTLRAAVRLGTARPLGTGLEQRVLEAVVLRGLVALADELRRALLGEPLGTLRQLRRLAGRLVETVGEPTGAARRGAEAVGEVTGTTGQLTGAVREVARAGVQLFRPRTELLEAVRELAALGLELAEAAEELRHPVAERVGQRRRADAGRDLSGQLVEPTVDAGLEPAGDRAGQLPLHALEGLLRCRDLTQEGRLGDRVRHGVGGLGQGTVEVPGDDLADSGADLGHRAVHGARERALELLDAGHD